MRFAALLLMSLILLSRACIRADDDVVAISALQKVKADITRDEKLPGRPVVAINL